MITDFNLNKKMTSGIKWAGLGQLLGYIFQLIVWAILARLLPAGDFGALSIAAVFSNMGVVFNDLGMASAIIQRKDLNLKHTVTAFWGCIIIGVLFLVLAILGAPFIAGFFKNCSITYLVIIFAVKYFVDSFGLIQEALFKREMLFKKVSCIDIVSNLVYGLSAVTMALRGIGIMSIGLGYLAASIVRVFLLWLSGSFRPYFGFDAASFKELFRFGKNIFGFKIFSFITGSIDIVLIGKLLGSSQLGHYSLASNLANFPRQKLSLIVSTVAFSAFSKIQDDYNRLRQAYLRIVRYAAVINFPLLIGLMFLAPQLVRLVYSLKWDIIILPLRILCVYGICFSITTFVGIIFDATGHPEVSFKFCVINLLGTGLAILSGFKYGLIGITAALSVYAVIVNIIGHLLIGRIIKLSLLLYLKSMMPALIASGIMASGIFLSVWIKYNVFMLPDMWFLFTVVFLGAVFYAFSLFLFSRQTFREMVEIGSNFLKRKENL